MRTCYSQILAVGFWILGVCRVGADGYLATIGPVGLRFRPASAAAPSILPPLSMGPKVPEDLPAKTPPSPEPETPAAPLPETPKPEGDSPVSVNTAASPARIEGAPFVVGSQANTNAIVSPQMFLRFFNQSKASGTNLLNSVIIPLEFNPALPPSTSSSAATHVSKKP